MDKLIDEVKAKAEQENVTLADNVEEDALINGLFAQIGWKFIANRGNADAFESAPNPEAFLAANVTQSGVMTDTPVETYSVNVDGTNYNVAVGPSGSNLSVQATDDSSPPTSASSGEVVESPMAGNILKVNATVGAHINQGDVVLIMEAMKMETEVRSKVSGTVSALHVKEGDAVAVGETLVTL
jgi:oxaloacetate decarboxylase alpha subunit